MDETGTNITVTCVHCGTVSDVPLKKGEQFAVCPECSKSILIKQPSQPLPPKLPVGKTDKYLRKGCLGTFAFLFIFFIAMIVLGTVFGDRIAKEDRQKAESALKAVHRLQQSIKEQRQAFNEKIKTEPLKSFAPYAEAENWDGFFAEALDAAGSIEKTYEIAIAPILKRNKSLETANLQRYITEVYKEIKAVKPLLEKLEQRIAHYTALKAAAPERAEKAAQQITEGRGIVSSLADYTGKAKEAWPGRAGDIDRLIKKTSVAKMQADAEKALEAAQAALADAGKADYRIVSERLEQVSENLAAIRQADKAHRKKIGELYESRTEILFDMRTDYRLVIARGAWCDSLEYDNTTVHKYWPVTVPRETFEYFIKLDPNKILATLTYQYGFSANPKIDLLKWYQLKIDPDKLIRPGDFSGEFWLEDAYLEYFHKYIIIKNGIRKKTYWIEVNEDKFYALYDYLGMEVLNKPYGQFEEEGSKTAAPPGLAFVGLPRYGQWRPDPASGDDYWEFSNEYAGAFDADTISGRRYYRNEWTGWQSEYRGKKAYFGNLGEEEQVYGTFGSYVRNSSQYQTAAFVAGGGLAASAASVRGAGPGRRGRGPGGRGK